MKKTETTPVFLDDSLDTLSLSLEKLVIIHDGCIRETNKISKI